MYPTHARGRSRFSDSDPVSTVNGLELVVVPLAKRNAISPRESARTGGGIDAPLSRCHTSWIVIEVHKTSLQFAFVSGDGHIGCEGIRVRFVGRGRGPKEGGGRRSGEVSALVSGPEMVIPLAT